MITEVKPKKKKKIKQNIYINDQNDNEDEINGTEEQITTKKKKTKKKKRPKTEVKTKKEIIEDIQNLENIENNSDTFSEKDEIVIKPKKKKKKKTQTIIINNDNENQIQETLSEPEELTMKPKKKKKKKKKTTQPIPEEEERNNISDNDIQNQDEVISKPKTKKKKKKKKSYINTDDNNENNILDIENDNRPKTTIIKKTKKNNDILNGDYEDENNNINNINEINRVNISEDEKSEKKEEDEDDKDEVEYEEKAKGKKRGIFSNDKDSNVLYLKRLGKILNINNRKEMNLTKSMILNSFSRKARRKVENDYEEEKNEMSKIVEEENDSQIIDDSSKFIGLLKNVNDLEYQGYNYSIQKTDYFKRKPNDQPIMTILNSEDAAIKKCEELMEMLGESENWKDPDFGPQEKDNGKGNRNSILGDDGSSMSLGINLDYVQWYSIKEINDEATFFYDGTESNDVMQGALGDCWFISALSVIATKDYLLRGEFNEDILNDGVIDEEEIKMMSEGIYPPIFHCFSSKGIYCFRFFKNFKWRYVLVDDRLPCHAVYNENQTKKLIFAHCRQDNEFWVPLIEKAYAKIHGSYYALVSGCIDDGLVDMTGLVSKKVLKDNDLLSMPSKIEDLWNKLKYYSSVKFDKDLWTQSGKKVTSKYFTRNKSMMGCSVDPNSRNKEMEVSMKGHKIGIIAGHAYSILDAFEIPKARSKKPRKCSRLLRIRNPWGNYEWNGKWCDNSEEIIKNKERIENVLKKKYEDSSEKIDFSKDDGTFLMRFSDFRKIFNNIFFCQNFPPTIIGVRFYDKWTKENSGGLPLHNTNQEFIDFFRNPQYYFQINKAGRVIICLLQEDGRLYGTKFPFEEYIKKVCLIVFKVKNENPINTFDGRVDQTVIAQRRDLSLDLNLERGSYIAIPSLKDKGVCANFNLEFYFEDELLTNKGNKEFNFDQLKNGTIIKKLDTPAKYELIKEYIASQLKMTSKNKLDYIKSVFQSIIKKNKEENNNKKTNKGFDYNEYNDDEDF